MSTNAGNPTVTAAVSTNTGARSTNPQLHVPHHFSTLKQPFSLKLDMNNYSLWKTMVSTIVRGHRLDGFLNGTNVCPSEYVYTGSTEDGSKTIKTLNPEFENWIVNDQLLMGWLYSSMTETIATEVMGSTSAAGLWHALEQLYGAHSKSKMDDTRTLIQTTKKGGTPMIEYLRQKKSWADSLALAGEPYPEAQLATNVLSRLDINYLTLVLQIKARTKTSWQELQELLLSFESKVERLGRGNNNSRGRHFNRGNGGRSRGRGRTNNSKPTCQVCGKYDHSAVVCYNWFDDSYMGSDPHSSNQNKTGQNNNNPSAFIATPEFLDSEAWFADSGASNNITADPSVIPQKQEYGGKEKVTVGNGDKLVISHFGNGKLYTKTGQWLKLNEMLLVPIIAKNFLSVSKLTTDNDVIIEFHSNSCFVKDIATRRVLLQGMLKDGLYQLQTPRNKSAYLRFSTSKFIVSDCNPFTVDHFCDACQYGKSHSLPFKHSNSKALKVLDLVHTDLWGPSPITSNQDFKYYVHFVDDCTRFTWIYPLKNKSEACDAFLAFKSLAENQFERKIKALRTDGGGEYQVLSDFVVTHGINFHHSCPHTSSQNGRAERKHRHIVEMGLTLLAQSIMPLKYWWDAFSTAVYLINRLPTPILDHKTPFEMLHKKIPDYKFLKTFGVACFPCLRPYQAHKFQFHSIKCVNLGYSDAHKGYKCLSPTGRIYILRDVVFNELEFPFQISFLNNYQSENLVIIQSSTWSVLPSVSPATGSRFTSANPSSSSQEAEPSTPQSRNFQNPNSREPTSVAEALAQKGWNKAMNEEIAALKTNKTYVLVPPAPSQNLIGNKWVFREKFNLDGTLQRLKARLVAKGFHQRLGIDFGETYSPVIKASTVRIILAIAVSKGWDIRQLDINNAFLNGTLEEDVFMAQPEGFEEKGKEHFVCKLNKSLYGLKQALRAWDETGLFLTQTKYIEDLLKRTKFINLKSCPTPAIAGKPMSQNDGEPLRDITTYKSIIGRLQYLCHTRPDIAYAVNKLNTDWACCPDDRKSVAGYCVYLGNTLVSWSSKKQHVVSRSSTESEYRALPHVSAKISWIESLLKEIGFPLKTVVTWCDNLGASALASNPVFHARKKHIEIDIHFVRDKVLRKELEVRYIPSSDQVADCLTKGLTSSRFHFLIDKVGDMNSPLRLRGDVRENETEECT
uniref:Integrase catalytic domain-containing protein n=1 Tax=Cannabis sativa TaxID=3483 RepID=A0A803QCY3_CANSA